MVNIVYGAFCSGEGDMDMMGVRDDVIIFIRLYLPYTPATQTPANHQSTSC